MCLHTHTTSWLHIDNSIVGYITHAAEKGILLGQAGSHRHLWGGGGGGGGGAQRSGWCNDQPRVFTNMAHGIHILKVRGFKASMMTF